MTPDAVTATLLVKEVGESGKLAARTATSLEKVVLKSKEFLDFTLKLYTVSGVRVTVVV